MNYCNLRHEYLPNHSGGSVAIGHPSIH